jgi:hypothetical protein
MRSVLLLFAFSTALAQQPQISNARLETHAITGLEPEMRRLLAASTSPAWVGYAVPMLAGQHSNQGCGRCSLEGHRGSCQTSGRVQLEGRQTLVVLVRFSNHAIDRVEAYTRECELDAGGLPFYWLTGVSSVESVQYLASLAPDRKQTVYAIAMHADPSADAALDRLAATSQPEKQREDVAFWLGSSRARRGVEILQEILTRDPSEPVRRQVMFALSVSREPAALAQLLASARNDRNPEVRSQALFWLAQKAGEKAIGAITQAVRDDPDTKVKTQAVFALSQLPPGEGVPLLIQVARSNANPEVRKQAMFWLGQSKDERALQFFEGVLSK